VRVSLTGRVGDDWSNFREEHGDLGKQQALGMNGRLLDSGAIAHIEDDVVVRITWDFDYDAIEPGTGKGVAFGAAFAFLPRDAVELESEYRPSPMAERSGSYHYRYVSSALAQHYPRLDWNGTDPGTVEIVLGEIGNWRDPIGGPINLAFIEFPPDRRR
jgi:hypothetical protein